jgi:molybdate transport system ATP-binding protein
VTLTIQDVVLPLADFTLEVSAEMTNQCTALYGPSGAGKTSLIEVIAGLRHPTAGRVSLDDTVLSDLRPQQRRVGYVSQDDTLFPHLNVRQNVTYGAARASHEGFSIDRVAAAVGIEHLLERPVQQLSGGERKRVALARALVSEPRILLLDEPLAGVDTELGGRVLEYLIRVRGEFPIPIVYVTHSLEEASAICDEIVVLDRGRVVSRRLISR